MKNKVLRRTISRIKIISRISKDPKLNIRIETTKNNQKHHKKQLEQKKQKNKK